MAHVFDAKLPHLGGNIAGGDTFTFYPRLWLWMVDALKVRTVLDVGCGEGHTINFFAALGCEVMGIDGLPQNVGKCKHPSRVHDLTLAPYINATVCDLLWCCEVVEHIPERYVDNLMKTLTRGKYVAITHATPGQRGYYHVNCRAASYWIDQFAKYGYILDETLTKKSKRKLLVPNPSHHWQKSGMIFTRLRSESVGLE